MRSWIEKFTAPKKNWYEQISIQKAFNALCLLPLSTRSKIEHLETKAFTGLLQNCSDGCKITSSMVAGKLNCLCRYLQINMYIYIYLCQRIKPVVSLMLRSRYLMSRLWSPGYCKICSFRTCDIASETARYPFDHSHYIECPGWKNNSSDGAFTIMTNFRGKKGAYIRS